MPKFYVVWVGRKAGIFNNWDDAKQQVDGFQGARYKSFKTLEEAKKAYSGPVPTAVKSNKEPSLTQIGARPHLVALSVDAACSGNPGLMEYQGVWIHNNKQEFISKQYPQGTNNIGEFLAIVHALALMEKSNTYYPLYTDSKIAMKWIADGKCKTKLEHNAKTAELMTVVQRAETWLSLPHDRKKWDIRKWETAEWGEIPADFGRK